MSKRTPAEFRDWPSTLAVTYGPYRARIRHHVDADTFDAFIDLGGRSYAYWPIRLLGVDAWESNRAGTREAGMRALLYVREVMPIGSPVVLQDTAPDPDNFGRWLARVIIAPGDDLGQLLLTAGHAVAWEDK